MSKVFKAISKFFSSAGFSSFLSIATMWSKYAIAVALLFITWQWNFLVPFLLSIVGSFLVGVLFHYAFPKLVFLAKYIVTVLELAILQWYSQAITKSLVLTAIFMAPFAMMIVNEVMQALPKKPGKEEKKPNIIVRVFGTVGDKLYGVERVFRLTLGAYFSFVFGLQSLVNECVLLVSFGIIGSAEIDIRQYAKKTINFCKKCMRMRIVFIPEDGILAQVTFQDWFDILQEKHPEMTTSQLAEQYPVYTGKREK